MVAFSENRPEWNRSPSIDRDRAATASLDLTEAADDAPGGVLRAAGDLRDDTAIHELRRCCEYLVGNVRGCLLIDLDEVTNADSRLMAVLLLVIRSVQQTGMQWELRASRPVRDWIQVYHLERFLLTETTQRSVAP